MGFVYSKKLQKELKNLFDSNKVFNDWRTGVFKFELVREGIDDVERAQWGPNDNLLRQFNALYENITKGELNSEQLASINELAQGLTARTEGYRTEDVDTQMDVQSDKAKVYYQLNTLVESAYLMLSLANIEHEQTEQTERHNATVEAEKKYTADMEAFVNEIESKDENVQKLLRDVYDEVTIKSMIDEYSARIDEAKDTYEREERDRAQVQKEKEEILKKKAPYEEKHKDAVAKEHAAFKDYQLKESKLKTANKIAQDEKESLDKAASNQAEKENAKNNLTKQIENLQKKLMGFSQTSTDLQDKHNAISEIFSKPVEIRRIFSKNIKTTFGNIYTDQIINKIPKEKSQFGEFYDHPDYIMLRDQLQDQYGKVNLESIKSEIDAAIEGMTKTQELLDTQKRRLRNLDAEKQVSSVYDNYVKDRDEAQKNFDDSAANLKKHAAESERLENIIKSYDKQLATCENKIKTYTKYIDGHISMYTSYLHTRLQLADTKNSIEPLNNLSKDIYAKHKEMKDNNPAIEQVLNATKERMDKQINTYFKQLNFLKGSHKDTTEFQALRNGVSALKDAIDGKADTAELLKKLEDLKKNTEDYIKAKKDQYRPHPSKLRTSRLSLADGIMSYCAATEAQLTKLKELQATQTTVNTYANEKILSDPKQGAKTEGEYVRSALVKLEEQAIAKRSAQKEKEQEQPEQNKVVEKEEAMGLNP